VDERAVCASCATNLNTPKPIEDGLEEELEQFVNTDPATRGLQETSGVRSENGGCVACRDFREVDRFARTDQAVAYAGMDVKIKESGKWKGKAKLSKRGSGRLASDALPGRPTEYSFRRLRRLRAYSHHLVERGLKKMSALMAVMRKMVAVATHLIHTGEDYDPSKVWMGAAGERARPLACCPHPERIKLR